MFKKVVLSRPCFKILVKVTCVFPSKEYLNLTSCKNLVFSLQAIVLFETRERGRIKFSSSKRTKVEGIGMYCTLSVKCWNKRNSYLMLEVLKIPKCPSFIL